MIVPTTKRQTVTYWVTTSLVAAVMMWSALSFAFNPAMKGAFAHLGLPNWFRVELTCAKLVGALVLLIPRIPKKVKELAYFGFGITLISAAIAHLSSGDSAVYELGHSLFFVSLLVSYFLFQKRTKSSSATLAQMLDRHATTSRRAGSTHFG